MDSQTRLAYISVKNKLISSGLCQQVKFFSVFGIAKKIRRFSAYTCPWVLVWSIMKNISNHLGRPFATTIKPLGQAFAKLLFKSLQVS